MAAPPLDLGSGPMLGRRLRRSERRKRYLAPAGLVRAANTALLLEWPLLLSGEPGCGKSDFAWAAASALAALLGDDPEQAEPHQAYVRSETRARDLLYGYDALRRFGDTQFGARAREQAADARAYVRREALGAALLSPRRCVVLIDEIDKAPRDLPNDLLRELEQGDFTIPEIPDNRPGEDLNRDMLRPRGVPLPLIVITSNNERQLPDPFLRRCVFYHIPFPTPAQMAEIIDSHFEGEPRRPDQALRDLAGRIFYALRDRLHPQKKPSTVEFLGWLRALLAGDGPPLRRQLEAVAAGITGDATAADLAGLRWTDELELGCLLKLRDDLRLLGLAG